MFAHLEDLDYDLAVLSTNHAHLQDKTTRLNKYAKQTGLYINETKTKVMHINSIPPTPLSLDGAEPESVDDLIYLGSVISKDNGTQKIKTSRQGSVTPE